MAKKRSVRITERDFELLKFLGEFCAVSVSDVGRLYNTKTYHETRLVVLGTANLIRRKDNLVYLGEEGKRYLKLQGLSYRRAPSARITKQRNPRVAKLYLDFAGSDWTFIPSWQYKQEVTSHKGERYYGVLEGSKTYALYNIGMHPHGKSIYNLKREIEKLPSKFGINRVIIFAESPTAMKAYGEESLGLAEQLLLPYNRTSIALIRALGSENIIKKATQLIFRHGGPPQWTVADYTVDNNKQAIVLILNDIEKRVCISEYYEFAQYRYTTKNDTVIICLDVQKQFYAQKYPDCQVATVTLDRLIGEGGCSAVGYSQQ